MTTIRSSHSARRAEGSSGAPADAAEPALRVAIIGNPNTGKTTLFNALTGLRQRVGNFAGVTVERVEGTFRSPDGRRVAVLDLPGSYSLSAGAPDEKIALEVLLGRDPDRWRPDVIVVVADAAHLERNLFLASQVIELGIPVVLALNQFDRAEADGYRIDVPELIHQLGVFVVPTVANRGEGLEPLKRAIELAPGQPPAGRRFTLPPAVAAAVEPLTAALVAAGLGPAPAAMEALRLLGVERVESHLSGVPDLPATLARTRAAVEQAGFSAERLESDLRYTWIADVIGRAVTRTAPLGRDASHRIDGYVLHRYLGPLIFILLMALVFQSVFTWAQPLIEGIEIAIGATGEAAGRLLPAGDLRSLVVDGVFGGVGSVLVFL
ncbi:MAG: ferrous iron transporter B, partial [Gemmatimonadetes bacterium]|nr:ferrous iron transporter B [Gemmatimonadota bacterium]